MNPSDVILMLSQWSLFDFWHREKLVLMLNIFCLGNDTMSVTVTTCCRNSKISYTSVMVWSNRVWNRVMWVAFVVSQAGGWNLWTFIWRVNIFVLFGLLWAGLNFLHGEIFLSISYVFMHTKCACEAVFSVQRVLLLLWLLKTKSLTFFLQVTHVPEFQTKFSTVFHGSE